MSFDRIYRKIVFHCDDCQDYIETDEGSLPVASRLAKSMGWLIIKEDGEFRHICPECAG